MMHNYTVYCIYNINLAEIHPVVSEEMWIVGCYPLPLKWHGAPLIWTHTPFLTLNVENKYSAHISVTYSRYVISLVEIHQVVAEESHRTNERTDERTELMNTIYPPLR